MSGKKFETGAGKKGLNIREGKGIIKTKWKIKG
jgi:hypothetical protein